MQSLLLISSMDNRLLYIPSECVTYFTVNWPFHAPLSYRITHNTQSHSALCRGRGRPPDRTDDRRSRTLYMDNIKLFGADKIQCDTLE